MKDCPPTRWRALAAAYAGSVLFLAGIGFLVSVSCGVMIGVGWRAFEWASGE